MKFHWKCVLSFLHEHRTQVLDQDVLLRSLKHQLSALLVHPGGNFLFYLETTHPGLLLLKNCQEDLHLRATEPHAVTILTPGQKGGGPQGSHKKQLGDRLCAPAEMN